MGLAYLGILRSSIKIKSYSYDDIIHLWWYITFMVIYYIYDDLSFLYWFITFVMIYYICNDSLHLWWYLTIWQIWPNRLYPISANLIISICGISAEFSCFLKTQNREDTLLWYEYHTDTDFLKNTDIPIPIPIIPIIGLALVIKSSPKLLFKVVYDCCPK